MVFLEAKRHVRASSIGFCVTNKDESGSSVQGVAWIHTKPPVGQQLRRVSGWLDGWIETEVYGEFWVLKISEFVGQ